MLLYIYLGLLSLMASFEPVEAASSMLGGSSHAVYASGGSLFGTNASVSVDTLNGMSRIHGSGLHLNLDLLEILTQRGIFRISPTHTEFQQNQSSATWAQLYSNDEMTIYYDNGPVVQLAGGQSSSLTVNGVGYFTDVALDKSKSNLLGVALCRLQASLKGGNCDSADFGTIHDALIAMVQDLITLSGRVKAGDGGSAEGNPAVAAAAPPSGVGIDEKQLHAHVKMALANVEAAVVESKPMQEIMRRHEEGMRKALQESSKKAEDLSVKLQAGIASLSKDSELASSKLRSLEERVSTAEAEGGSALRDDVERVRRQVKELDSSFSTSLEDLRKRTDKSQDALKVTVTESAIAVGEALQALREDAHSNLTSTKQEFDATIATLGKDFSAAAEKQALRLAHNLDMVNATVNALTQSTSSLPTLTKLEQLNASLRADYGTDFSAISNSVGAVNTSVIDLGSALAAHADKTSAGLLEVSNNISTAVARGNGILSKVIGEMNVTIRGSIRNHESLTKEVLRVELEGKEKYEEGARTDRQLEASVAELTGSIASLQKETSERAHEQAIELEQRLQSVNATALDKVDLVEGRLVQGLDEIAKEVSLVETAVKDVLAQHAQEMESHRQATNVTAAAALASALQSVDREIKGLQTSVATQLTELNKAVSSLSETSSVAREVLAERITSLNARVSKEEEETTRASETSAQNREKISKIEGQLGQCEARGREIGEDASKMRDRITKLETLVEVLMKK